MLSERNEKAATRLEELSMVLKDVIVRLRDNPDSNLAHALVYNLRREIGYVARDMYTSDPTMENMRVAQRWATELIEDSNA